MTFFRQNIITLRYFHNNRLFYSIFYIILCCFFCYITRLKLKDSIVEGSTPFERVTEMKGFEYMAYDPRFGAIFNKAMKDTSTILMTEILKHYDGFNNLKTLVDVGGGLGGNLYMIVSKHKNIKGINFDLPNMIRRAPQFPGMYDFFSSYRYMSESNITFLFLFNFFFFNSGVEHVAGDMFDSVPEGDAIFLKVVLVRRICVL